MISNFVYPNPPAELIPLTMKRISGPTLLLLAIAVTPHHARAGDADRVALGRHLVEDVGLCADCHSPRNEHGEFIREKWLHGSPLGFAPTVPMPVWGPVAPPIAGLPNYNDAEALTLLTKGTTNHGGAPRPPMPAFRFSKTEAQAVIAYLRTLVAKT